MDHTPLHNLPRLAIATCLLAVLALSLGCSREGDEAKKEVAESAQKAAPAPGSPAETPATAGRALGEPATVGTAPPAAPEPSETVDEALEETTPAEEAPPTVGTAPPAAPAPTETVDEALKETTPTEDAPVETDRKPPYQVVDGRIDADTVEGWKIYRGIGTCATCHGPAGQGGVGANLTESLKERVDYELFKQIVANGKPGTMMKPFKTNKAVMDNIDKLYAYLKARADGVLGPGNLLKEPLGKGS